MACWAMGSPTRMAAAAEGICLTAWVMRVPSYGDMNPQHASQHLRG